MNTSPRSSRRASRPVLAALAAVLVVGTAACSDDKKSEETTVTSSASAPAESAATTISGAWARTSPANADKGAMYMTITSATADKLINAAVDTAISAKTEIHEMVMEPATSSSETHATTMGSTGNSMPGAMAMRKIDSLDIPAGTAVELKPGGYHVMLIGLVKPLVAGSNVELTLTFEKAGDVKVTVPVRDDAP